jgi:hypothetical protein
MALPGSQGHPPPKTEVEAMTQLIQLVFQVQHQLQQLTSELHFMNGHLQTIAMKTGR